MNLTHEELLAPYHKRRWKSWTITSTASALENLSLDLDEQVRLGVAWNPKTSEKTLILLTQDESEKVRIAAQANFQSRFGGKEKE